MPLFERMCDDLLASVLQYYVSCYERFLTGRLVCHQFNLCIRHHMGCPRTLEMVPDPHEHRYWGCAFTAAERGCVLFYRNYYLQWPLRIVHCKLGCTLGILPLVGSMLEHMGNTIEQLELIFPDFVPSTVMIQIRLPPTLAPHLQCLKFISDSHAQDGLLLCREVDPPSSCCFSSSFSWTRPRVLVVLPTVSMRRLTEMCFHGWKIVNLDGPWTAGVPFLQRMTETHF